MLDVSSFTKKEEKDLTLNFCWVSANTNIFEGTGRVISADTTNLEKFKQEGFKVQIPYYLSTSLSSSVREEMEKNIKQNHKEAVDFNKILQEDEGKPELYGLPLMVKSFLQMVEKTNSSPSGKICAIVEVMKLYMSAKNDNMVLDFNVELKNKELFLERLKNSDMYLSKNNSNVDTRKSKIAYLFVVPENKMLYINNNNPYKTSLAYHVIEELNQIQNEGLVFSRDTVFVRFLKHVKNFQYDLTTGEDLTMRYNSLSYNRADYKSEFSNTKIGDLDLDLLCKNKNDCKSNLSIDKENDVEQRYNIPAHRQDDAKHYFR